MKTNQMKYSEQEIMTFGNYFLNGHTLKETSNFFGINYHTLKQLLIKFGYRKPTKKLTHQRVSKITYFDSIDSHEKAYFLGLLYSDGYISSTPYGVNVGIALQLQDKYILDYFKQELGVNNKISIYKNSAKFSVTCQNLYDTLSFYGIKENKSHSEFILPNINNEYINSFILGYFDGDGCITIKSSGYSVVSMCCNSKIFLESVQKYLNTQNIGTRSITMEKREHGNLYVLYLSKRENQLKFKNFIYKNSKIFLKRKYNKFLQIPS